jgi:hypothetical protein
MKAVPAVGDIYAQEFYPGEAEDMGYVVRPDATVEIDDEIVCENCLQAVDWNPLEPDTLEYKYYAPDVGLVLEEKIGGDEVVEPQGVE